ncbi:hypothetical protein [Sorangium sp. So ce321]|uniref:hypothetical protein n=1 Tax=Sorangium sp. So ce321 TaxID=3133300 RepID=UPI003F646A24
MSRAPVDAPAETAAEVPTATEAALIEMVLGIPGVAPRILGTAALPSLGRLSPAALAERTQIALLDATRLAAAFGSGGATAAPRPGWPRQAQQAQDPDRGAVSVWRLSGDGVERSARQSDHDADDRLIPRTGHVHRRPVHVQPSGSGEALHGAVTHCLAAVLL